MHTQTLDFEGQNIKSRSSGRVKDTEGKKS